MTAPGTLSSAPANNRNTDEPLLEVRRLVKYFPIRKGLFGSVVGHVQAVDDVSFDISAGKTYSLVGESGCGKTTTGRTILRLIEPTSGEVFFDKQRVFEFERHDLATLLRRRMQIIFQDPYSSLNPRMTVSAIVGEGLTVHGIGTPDERRDRVRDLLKVVGLHPSAADKYPHEFSGGQRQRIGIARAVALNPDFIVCDEAVSALDVSIQAQIINLLQDLQAEHNIAYLFIAHDLAVVRHISDRVGVMYLGHLMEEADVDDLFAEPLHPYTRALMKAIPQIDPSKRGKTAPVTGDVPSADNPPDGCRFHTRCPEVMPDCRQGEIPTFRPAEGRCVKCLLYR